MLDVNTATRLSPSIWTHIHTRAPRRIVGCLLAITTALIATAVAVEKPSTASLKPVSSSLGRSVRTAPAVATRSSRIRWRPSHVVVVVLENRAFDQIDHNSRAPYLNYLMAHSAVMTRSHGITHPSLPNYLALFSGSTQHVTSDRCPLALGNRANLGRQLLDAGFSFVGYAEGLPYAGYQGCSRGRYVAKHNPWMHFGNLPARVNQPATAFPTTFTKLPNVAFLIPNLCNDMHDCSTATGDAWIKRHVGPYVTWASSHNSLLVITFDEDDSHSGNRILTLVAGARVRPGRYSQDFDHYSLQATLEGLFGLTRLGAAASVQPATAIFS